MKSIYLSLLCGFLCAAMPLRAGEVNPEKAGKVAQRYMQARKGGLRTPTTVRLKHAGRRNATIGRREVQNRTDAPASSDAPLYYVFDAEGGGFVIVAGDDAVKPVLGYAPAGSYDDDALPPNFAEWLDDMRGQIAAAREGNSTPAPEVQQEWDGYTDEAAADDGLQYAVAPAVAPLLSTSWSQEPPYANLCPKFNGVPAPTGCVATAMAQIMKYWRHPARGTGQSPAYTTNGVTVPMVNYEVDYDWDNMLDNYRGGATTQQQNAVATLMFHCGAAVGMQYGANASGARSENVPAAMKEHFGYEDMTKIYSTIDGNLRMQIDAGMPVYCSGGSHAWVCDGYDADGMFHFNWGWNGSYDGYYLASTPNPGGTSYASNLTFIGNIRPDDGSVATYQIALNTVFTSNMTAAVPDETFAVMADFINVGNANFPSGGSVGVMLTGGAGQPATLIGSLPAGRSFGQMFTYDPYYIPCKIPAGTAEGAYMLRAAVKTADGEWELISSVDCPETISFRVGQSAPGAVTGVSLNKTTLTLAVNSSERLTATVVPANATDKSVTWSSSNPAVATVSADGTVTAEASGTAMIAATTRDGGKTAYCTVTVPGGGDCSTPRASGTAGALTWTLCPDGTLTISGTGPMTDTPWKNNGNSGYITNVMIADGVTNIYKSAFSGCAGLTSVVIPLSITDIGERAFYRCTGLTSVMIPNSVVSIGSSAFDGCTGLTSVMIPNSVVSIGSFAFNGCTGLTSVSIGNSVVSIGSIAFNGCTGLTSVSIGNSVETIGLEAFSGCTALTSVSIGNSVETIGEEAFSGCTSLTFVSIGNSVKTIGNNAFEGCTGLTSVTIPNSVKTIGILAFKDCSKLATVHIGSGLTSLVLTSVVDYDPKLTFLNCPSLEAIHVDAGNAVFSSDGGVLFNKAKTEILLCPQAIKGSYTVPNSVTAIGDNVFNGCIGLTAVDLGTALKTIGSSAFRGCTSIASISNLSSATSIGNSAFYGCTALKEVNFGNSLRFIGTGAFKGCTGLTGTDIVIPKSVTQIGREDSGYSSEGESFYGYNLNSLTIGTGVGFIGNRSFGSVEVVYFNAVNCEMSYRNGSANFQTFTTGTLIIGEGVRQIQRNAFPMSYVTSVIIPSSVTAIGDDAFSDNYGLKEIVNLAAVPQAINANVFTDVDKPVCTLRVPEASVEAYRTAEVWKEFMIVAIGPDASITGVTVTPDPAFVQKGTNLQFTANVAATDNAPQIVIWSVSGQTLPTTNISATGLLTVPANETATALTVTATSAYDQTKHGTAAVTVTSTPVTPAVTSVAITPATASVQHGQTQQFTAAVTATGGAPQTVTWSVSGNTSNTTVITTGVAGGLLTVAADETAIALTVTATSTYDQTKHGTAAVMVIPGEEAPSVTSVTVTPNSASVQPGKTQQFAAVVAVTGNAPQTVTWSVSGNTSNTTGVAGGLLTVAADETATALTVTATSTYDNTKQGTAAITLIPGEEAPAVTSVMITPATASVQKGRTQQFVAAVEVTGGAPQTVTWSVSGHALTATNIDATGLLTIAAGEMAGTLTVTATSTHDNTKQGTATVTIKTPPVTPEEEVAVSGTVAGAPVGTEVQLYEAAGGTTKASVPGGYSYVASTTTNASGHYLFDHLPPGVYIVLVIMEGRESEPTPPISLEEGKTASDVNFTVKGDTVIPDEEITGTGELFAPDMKVYPNPFTDVVRIAGADGCILRVINTAGVVVHTQKITNTDEAIGLEHLPAGVYFLRFEKDGKAKTVRVVKQ